MSVFRIQKSKNYTVMSNYHLRDKNLSLKAKGLLSLMLSLPDDWDYSIGGLASICKENKTAVTTALKELKMYGYVVTTKLNPDQTPTGRIDYAYDIFESPQDAEQFRTGNSDSETVEESEDTESQMSQKQIAEKQVSEIPPQLNIDNKYKEIQNPEGSNKDVCLFCDRRTVLHDEVRKYFLENDLQGDVDCFITYNLYMNDEMFAKKYKSLAKKWSDNEYVDMPIRMYDDQYREAVLSVVPPDLAYSIRKELEDSDCMQIKYRSYQRLEEIMNEDDFGVLSL